MINTIFYFPESLTFNEYINKLDKDTEDGISKRTIVFAEEQGRIYKNGQIYGTNTYDVQNLIEQNRYNDEYVRAAIEQLEHDLQDESNAIDLQGQQYLALAGRVKTVEDHGYVNEAEILTAVAGEIDGSTQKSSIRNKINNVAKEASAALFTEVSDSNDYITAQSIVNAITTNTAARSNLASSFTSGDNQMWAGALTQADLTNSSSALYAALRDKANDNEVVKQASVIASINSSGESGVSISADKIDVGGIRIAASNVTGIDNLVANQINSAYINAEHITSGVLSADRLNISQIVGKLVNDSTQMQILANNLDIDSDSLYVRTAAGVVMADINATSNNRPRVHFMDGLFQMDYADYNPDGTPHAGTDAYLQVWNTERTKQSALGCGSFTFQNGSGRIFGGYAADYTPSIANGGGFSMFGGLYGSHISRLDLYNWGDNSSNFHLGCDGWLNGHVNSSAVGALRNIGMGWHGDIYTQKLVAANSVPWGLESSFNDANATVIQGSGVTANQFVNRNYNDNYVLLAGGGVKALSDFSSGTGTGTGTSSGTVAWSDVTNKPNFASVATSGSYNDLSNRPTLFSGEYNDLINKPTLATVATSGSYSDLSNTPTFKTINGVSITGTGDIVVAGTSGSGTVTSVAAGTGLTGGTITTSGTLAVDTTWLATQCLTIPSTGAISVPRSLDFAVGEGLRFSDSGSDVELECNGGLSVTGSGPDALYVNGNAYIDDELRFNSGTGTMPGYGFIHYTSSAPVTIDATSAAVNRAGGTGVLCFIYGNTDIDGILTSTNVSSSSDETLKNKVADVELTAEQIAEAPAIKYTWKDNERDQNVHVGTIAQYWQEVLPETVSTDSNEKLTLDYQGAAMAAVINLAKEVVELKAKIAELESKLNNA